MLDTTMQDATANRIAIAGEDTFKAEGPRVMRDEPMQRLAARKALWPKSADINAKLYEAGERYYKDYYLSNMDSLASFDPTRVFSGGSGAAGGMPASERQAQHRSAYRAARKAVDKFFLEPVDLVAVQGQGDFVAIGRKLSGLKGEDVCRAIATERLRMGLYLLATHYGLLPKIGK